MRWKKVSNPPKTATTRSNLFLVIIEVMQSVGKILKNFNPVEDKYISREFQKYGIYLTEELEDYKHKSLYIKLAKTIHRSILEKALTYVSDSNAKNRGALFMWKLQQLRTAENPKSQISNPKNEKV